MPSELMSEYGPKLIVAVLGVGLALVCLVGILWIVRGRRGPSPFVRGGRNRQPRLQVLDAAAVDARRRLVLVRRDDVEHLIMIGGPTDVVIESRIANPTQSVEAPAQEPHPVQPRATAAPAAPAAAKLTASEPARRPTPAPAPRTEAIRDRAEDALVRETRVAAVPQPAAAIAANPVPMSRIEPAATPSPASPARLEPVQSRPRVETAAAPQPSFDDAASLLDSQRDRVFAERSTPQPAAAPAIRPVSQQAAAPAERPTGLGSDFEKILEEEMAQNMAARDASLANRPLPQAGPAVAVPMVTAPGRATRDEPSLQSEVARIFGEMSASRDK